MSIVKYVELERLRDELRSGSVPALQFFGLWNRLEDPRFFAKAADGRFLAASPNVLTLNGMSGEDEIVGLSDRDLYPGGMAESFIEADRRVLAAGRPVLGIREAILDRKGVLAWYETDKHPILSREGEVLGIMGISRRRGEASADAPAGMESVARYIREHFREDLPAERLALRFRVSVRHFQRMFREHFGLPPLQYQIRMRVLAARELIVSDPRPVSEIGLALGFSDETLFIRHFKKVLGTTPMRYRREAWRRG